MTEPRQPQPPLGRRAKFFHAADLRDRLVELKRLAVEYGTTPQNLLNARRRLALEGGEDLEDWLPDLEQAVAAAEPLAAESAPGVAQESLVRLLSTDKALRGFFVDLAYRSGVVHRNAIRLEKAVFRARIYGAFVDEVERYLTPLEHPSVPLGARPNKRRDAIRRNVGWFYRNVVKGESILSLARAEYAPDEPDISMADAIAFDRRKDVREGI